MIPKISFGVVRLALPAALVLWYTWTLVQYPVDFWHCLVDGALIWQSGSPLIQDASTFTIFGNWVSADWLARLSVFGLFSLGGFELAQFVAGLLYALAVLVITLLTWHRSADTRVAAGLAFLVVALIVSSLSVRTQSISVPLFAIELLLLWRWPGRAWTIGVVALVEILWVNTHGAFPLGVVLPGMFLLAAAWQRWPNGGYRGWLADRSIRCYLGCVVAGSAAMFCNPRPHATMGYVFGVTSTATELGIGEWVPTASGSFTGTLFFLSIIFVIVVLALSKKPLEPIELLLLVTFALLGYQAVRMVIWWAMVMAPVMGPQVSHLIETRRKKPAPDDRGADTFFVILVLACMTLFCTPWTRALNPILPPSKRQSHADDDPRHVIAFLKQEGFEGRAFCTMEWGSCLSWHLNPEIKVFIDSRMDFYPRQIWSDYFDIGTVRENWRELLDQYQVDLVVWNLQLSDALPRALERSEEWQNVYRDELAAVYVRHAPRYTAPGRE